MFIKTSIRRGRNRDT